MRMIHQLQAADPAGREILGVSWRSLLCHELDVRRESIRKVNRLGTGLCRAMLEVRAGHEITYALLALGAVYKRIPFCRHDADLRSREAVKQIHDLALWLDPVSQERTRLMFIEQALSQSSTHSQRAWPLPSRCPVARDTPSLAVTGNTQHDETPHVLGSMDVASFLPMRGEHTTRSPHHFHFWELIRRSHHTIVMEKTCPVAIW